MRRNAGLAAAFRPDYGSRAVAGDLKPTSEVDEALIPKENGGAEGI